jgi:hypothetical protein
LTQEENAMGSHQAERGSALLVVVVLIAVLAIVGLAIVTRASSEGAAAAAKRQYDKSVSCADSARELLMSQFRLYGSAPSTLVLNTPIDDKTLATGHYDNIAVTSVTAATGATANQMGVSDVSNRIARVAMGGQLYRMTVVCSGANGTRQSEVEFMVRFGL